MEEKKIVHVETQVKVFLGELDDEGNVINKTPFDFVLQKLDSDVFANLKKTVDDFKLKMSQKDQ